MKIAILGGSFDPPHVGHILVATQVKKMLNIDQVWLMPTFSHPFNKHMLPAKQRLTMTKLLEDDQIKVSDFEIHKKGVSYTINTLQTLSKLYEQHTFFWIIGSDQISDFPKWKDWEEIITKFHLIIYARGESPKELEEKVKVAWGLFTVPGTIHILDTKDVLISPVSSTSIRELRKKNLPVKGHVPKKVEEYILENDLYAK
jgi:nicotinate (nicotinamide) nucleotide adenylyltransferase